MKSAEAVSQGIRKEFAGVSFPFHRGLHAAMAMDNWTEDEKTLRRIAQQEDYIGEWWDVPKEHLHQCMMALSYLDAFGVEFYLPAYMNAVVEDPKAFDEPRVRSSSWQVVHTMLPDKEDQELTHHFCDRFSRIRGGKKRVCREFLQYIANCGAYNEHARQIAKEALNHEFWSSNS